MQARSSGGERCFHTAEVDGSKPSVPTTSPQVNPFQQPGRIPYVWRERRSYRHVAQGESATLTR